MPLTQRYQRSRTNTDMPCIRDTERNRIVALFFVDPNDPDAAMVNAAACVHALNTRAERQRPGQRSLLEVAHGDF